VQSTAAILEQSTTAMLEQSTAAILEQSTAAILEDDCRPAVLNQSTAAILEADDVTALAAEPPLPAAYGHGTEIAGLIRLVAPGARILPLKAFTSDGVGRSSDIAQAIYLATVLGARVINMSFTFQEVSQEVMWASAYAASRGVVLVAAAGNAGLHTRAWPAQHKWVLGVGATTLTDTRASFSNWGYEVFKTGAPGVDLVTTFPGGRYAAVSGTSFSAALVSGTVALMAQAAPNLEWGATNEVAKLAPFALVENDGLVADGDDALRRIVVPVATQYAIEYQRDWVKQINVVR
jgi:subtilisin family serine protease